MWACRFQVLVLKTNKQAKVPGRWEIVGAPSLLSSWWLKISLIVFWRQINILPFSQAFCHIAESLLFGKRSANNLDTCVYLQHTFMLRCSHMHIYKHIFLKHICIYIHNMHFYSHTHIHIHTHACAHTHTHIHTHACAHARTFTVLTHLYTRTYVHATHSHKFSYTLTTFTHSFTYTCKACCLCSFD